MKVSHLLEIPDREIEVEVSIEDIMAALEEVPADDRPRTVLLFCNRVAGSLKAVTTDMIKELNPAQRKVIGDFLAEESARYINQNLLEEMER